MTLRNIYIIDTYCVSTAIDCKSLLILLLFGVGREPLTDTEDEREKKRVLTFESKSNTRKRKMNNFKPSSTRGSARIRSCVYLHIYTRPYKWKLLTLLCRRRNRAYIKLKSTRAVLVLSTVYLYNNSGN